jgi:hypothetical protein
MGGFAMAQRVGVQRVARGAAAAVVVLALAVAPVCAAEGGFTDPAFAGLTPLPAPAVGDFVAAAARPVPPAVSSAIQLAPPGRTTMIDFPVPMKEWAMREAAGRAPSGSALDPEAHLASYLMRNRERLLAGEARVAAHPQGAEHAKAFGVAVTADSGSLSPQAKTDHVLAAARDLVRMKEQKLGRPLTPAEKAELYVELKHIAMRLSDQVAAGNVLSVVKLGSLSSSYNFPQEYPQGLLLTRRFNPTQVLEYAFRTDSWVKVRGKVRTANAFTANLLAAVVHPDLSASGNPGYAGIRAALLANRLVRLDGSVTRTDAAGHTARMDLPGSTGSAGAQFARDVEASILFQAVSREGQTYHYEGSPVPAPSEITLLPNPFALMPAEILLREKQVYWSREFAPRDHEGLSGGKAKYTFVSLVKRGGGFFSSKGFKCVRLDGELYDARLVKVGRSQAFVDVASGALIEETADVRATVPAAGPDATDIEVRVSYGMELGRVVRPGTISELVPRPID